jgi:hypothetical protein
MVELSGLTIVQLLEEHNRIAGVLEQETLQGWDKDRKVLIDKLLVMREQEKRRRPARTIKAAAYSMLLEVDYEDHNKRPVGHSYDVILARLQDEFPDSNTSDKCLRWYAVQLNADQAKVPFRPRRMPKRVKKVATDQDKKDILG